MTERALPVPTSVARPAFADVYAEHAAFVWRTLRRLGVREADVADACQDAFVVVHRRLDSFADGSLRAWLFAICLRVASDHRRRAHVRREIATDEPPDHGAAPAQHEQLERKRAREVLDRALDALDDDKRAVFVLYELEGLGMAEVAQMVGAPLQTAYSRLHAARNKVQQVIEREKARGA